MRMSVRQLEVLRIIGEFDSECWADVWSHCDGWPGGPLRSYLNFCRTADALVGKGLVSQNDNGDITITSLGKIELERDR